MILPARFSFILLLLSLSCVCIVVKVLYCSVFLVFTMYTLTPYYVAADGSVLQGSNY